MTETTKYESYNEHVKKKDKSTVDGYIRDVEVKLFANHSFYTAIPSVINHLCSKYYHESKDRFHPTFCSEMMEITNNCVTSTRCSASAFLSNAISTGIHHWRFKIKLRGFSYLFQTVFIGIISDSFNLENLNALYQYQFHQSFGLNVVDGERAGFCDIIHEEYCPGCKDNDIVDMILDLSQRELKYIINDKDYETAFDMIPEGRYRAGISMFTHSGNSVELISYQAK